MVRRCRSYGFAKGPEPTVNGVGIYFLGLVVLLTFVYLGYALFRPEKF
jgi:K+-transporting ATPase KdpF subunit